MVPRVGQRIGPYEILGRLGSGGMGLVFSAWDARLQRDVAIKLLRDEYCTPEMRSRFLQEARAASGLNHPNICTIFDIGEQKGDPYLVMELLKGQTLRQRIADGRLSLDDMVKVATEVADALTVAHAKGIIHRDIKPANIILVEKPGGRFQSKVLDFGLAKMDLGDGKEAPFDLTSIGSTVGTVSYMSPEQARGELLDARSDLFSLGVVMYEMATGQVPFRGATSALVFVQLLSHPPEAVRQLNGEIPKELERVISKLMEKDRGQRFQSAASLVEVLRRIPLSHTAQKHPWWGFGSLMKPRGPGAGKPFSSVPEELEHTAKRAVLASEPPAARPVRVGESVLRPVKRIVSSDSSLRPAVRPGVGSGAASTGPAAGSSAAQTAESSKPSGVEKPSGVTAAAGFAAAPSGSQSAATEEKSSSTVAAAGAASSARSAVAGASGTVAAAKQSNTRHEIAIEDPRSSSSVRIPRPLPEMRWHYSLSLENEPPEEQVAGSMWLWVVAFALLLAAGVAAWLLWPKHSVPVSSQPRTMVLASFSNLTGDSVLPGVVLTGLELDLGQSPLLTVETNDELRAGLQALGLAGGLTPTLPDAQRAARAIGANEMLVGEVRKFNSAYVLTLRVYEVATGARSAEVSETAVTREQIPDAIDRLASEVRSAVGESGDSIGRTSVPLRKEASSSVDALRDYVSGIQLMNSGHLIDAMHALESATVADPRFTQAYQRLAELYRRQDADVAAADAATLAQKSVLGASSRTLAFAETTYALDTDGDLAHASEVVQSLLNAYPEDTDAAVQMAEILRRQGRFNDALDASERVLSGNPYDLEASGVAERAMLALDRPVAAAQIETQVQRSMQSHPGLRVLTNYLGARDDSQLSGDLSGQLGRLALQKDEAGVLDASGLMESGLHVWRAVAAQASANPELLSAASEALASAAMDRAMVSDCVTAKELLSDAAAYPMAADALFASGMSEALCGDLTAAQRTADRLQRTYTKSFAVLGYYGPDLAAAIAWKQGDTAGALKTLESAQKYDLISMTPYLRGLIDLQQQQAQDAVADFDVVLGHRGAATLVNPVMYAMAQAGEARAHAADGDSTASVEAYRKFLSLWSAADSNLKVVVEARSHVPAQAARL
jgi:serine/threonine protein kinase/tetratricopeptide (TPR) repeat protein